jgi:Lar family restriction alleviation protein
MSTNADAGLAFERLVRLLPCPFCGSIELVVTNEADIYNRGNREMVACGGCGTQGPWGQHEQEASFLWNKRLEI